VGCSRGTSTVVATVSVAAVTSPVPTDQRSTIAPATATPAAPPRAVEAPSQANASVSPGLGINTYFCTGAVLLVATTVSYTGRSQEGGQERSADPV
jgi:hypothetical protein